MLFIQAAAQQFNECVSIYTAAQEAGYLVSVSKRLLVSVSKKCHGKPSGWYRSASSLPMGFGALQCVELVKCSWRG